VARSNGTWKPGQSGNPAGRPPGTQSPTALLRRALAEPYAGGGDLTKLEFLIAKVVEGLVRDAERGELPLSALLPVFARLDGSPPLGLPVDEARERLQRQEARQDRREQRANGAAALAGIRAARDGLY
jgi:hypothetical protein